MLVKELNRPRDVILSVLRNTYHTKDNDNNNEPQGNVIKQLICNDYDNKCLGKMREKIT